MKCKWGKNTRSLCPACNNPLTLGHLEEGRFNYRHGSAVMYLTKITKPAEGRIIYADIKGYANLSTITGEVYRPDILVTEH